MAGLVRTGPRLYDWTNTKLVGDTRSLLPLLGVKTYVASVPTFRFPCKYGLENKYLF